MVSTTVTSYLCLVELCSLSSLLLLLSIIYRDPRRIEIQIHFSPFQKVEKTLDEHSTMMTVAVNGKYFVKYFLMVVIPCVAGLSFRQNGSRVVRVEVCHLGGMTSSSDNDNDPIQVDLSSDEQSFTAVTGETGAGKSLILAKAASLVCGGKVSPSILGLDTVLTKSHKPISVGIEFHLQEPHLSLVNDILKSNKINLHFEKGDSMHCSRTITLHPPKSSTSNKFRLKSICSVNGQTVTLQALSSITSPLLSIVDGSIAASGLENSQVRRAIVDTSIPIELFHSLDALKERYRACRKEREKAQNRIQQSVLPTGFSRENEADQKLLQHWIDELDVFESRVTKFCLSFEDIPDAEATTSGRGNSGISSLCTKVAEAQWMDNDSSDPKQFSSKMYTHLLQLRDEIRRVDNQLLAANNALDTLTMLSSNESVLTALEKARRFTSDASQGSSNSPVMEAAEKCHDLLNAIEEATNECARHLEEDRSGLIQQLENERALCPISVEAIEEIILDWATLARKHGVPVQVLPSCHEALLQEKDGNQAAWDKIDQLVEQESLVMSEINQLCETIYEQRQSVAQRLSRLVSERLPSLGMEYSAFRVDVMPSHDSTKYSEIPWSRFSALGLDEVDFSLVHATNPKSLEEDIEGRPHAASLQDVASSGEKARILLAIECAIPGSVATACLQSNCKLESFTTSASRPSPVLVLYDEIDAHVGGNAGTAVAKMLLEQSRSCQVLAITHSPAVAALSDHHIVVQRERSTESTKKAIVSVKHLHGAQDRVQEIARMASGNLAIVESEAFADALMRDGASIRNATFSFAS